MPHPSLMEKIRNPKSIGDERMRALIAHARRGALSFPDFSLRSGYFGNKPGG
jgi:hypothetical protein